MPRCCLAWQAATDTNSSPKEIQMSTLEQDRSAIVAVDRNWWGSNPERDFYGPAA
jgi:hypothetical protein